MSRVAPRPDLVAEIVFFVRGERVLLDVDLAELYGVTTAALNRAVKRNRARFPADFMFQLNRKDWQSLKCQIGTSSDSQKSGARKVRTRAEVAPAHGGRRTMPYAFTEQGVAMLSSVLRSRRAVEVNIAIMRTFVQLRRLMDSNRELARKVEAMEKRYDETFATVFAAIKELISAPGVDAVPAKRRIGFGR